MRTPVPLVRVRKTRTELFKQAEGSKGFGHPVLFGLKEAEHFGPFPEGGGYPITFLQRAHEILGIVDSHAVLHVCSGSMKTGIRVDIRSKTTPTVIADAVHLPFRDNAFLWVMVDPPYSKEYAENLYGTGAAYPSPHVLINECLRVLKPSGRLGFMHHVIPKFKKPGRLLKSLRDLTRSWIQHSRVVCFHEGRAR